MKHQISIEPRYSRRGVLKLAGLAAASWAGADTLVQAQSAVRRGAAPVTITDVKNNLTQPAGDQLVIVKVLTREPGLGIDVNEILAAKFPYKSPGGSRGNDRRLDGTIVRP